MRFSQLVVHCPVKKAKVRLQVPHLLEGFPRTRRIYHSGQGSFAYLSKKNKLGGNRSRASRGMETLLSRSSQRCNLEIYPGYRGIHHNVQTVKNRLRR